MKGDKQLKQERGYRGKSYVRSDGSEVLFGVDWEVRKRELWKRADGRCEYFLWPSERCPREGVFPDHVTPRHPIRDDRLSNLKLGCRACSEANEKQSWRKPMFGDRTAVTKRRHRQ